MQVFLLFSSIIVFIAGCISFLFGSTVMHQILGMLIVLSSLILFVGCAIVYKLDAIKDLIHKEVTTQK